MVLKGKGTYLTRGGAVSTTVLVMVADGDVRKQGQALLARPAGRVLPSLVHPAVR